MIHLTVSACSFFSSLGLFLLQPTLISVSVCRMRQCHSQARARAHPPTKAVIQLRNVLETCFEAETVRAAAPPAVIRV